MNLPVDPKNQNFIDFLYKLAERVEQSEKIQLEQLVNYLALVPEEAPSLKSRLDSLSSSIFIACQGTGAINAYELRQRYNALAKENYELREAARQCHHDS